MCLSLRPSSRKKEVVVVVVVVGLALQEFLRRKKRRGRGSTFRLARMQCPWGEDKGACVALLSLVAQRRPREIACVCDWRWGWDGSQEDDRALKAEGKGEGGRDINNNILSPE